MALGGGNSRCKDLKAGKGMVCFRGCGISKNSYKRTDGFHHESRACGWDEKSLRQRDGRSVIRGPMVRSLGLF